MPLCALPRVHNGESHARAKEPVGEVHHMGSAELRAVGISSEERGGEKADRERVEYKEGEMGCGGGVGWVEGS